MENSVALVALAAVVALIVMYGLLKSARAEASRATADVSRLSSETTALSRQIETRARKLLEEWQQNEIVGIRDQQVQVAKREALAELEEWKRTTEESVRKDAISRSRSVTTGKVTEQMVPYFTEFPFNPKDARFIGSPIDFVVFDGLSDGEIKELVVVEVKTANAVLTKREKQVRDAIDSGRVKWKELRLHADSAVSDGSEAFASGPEGNVTIQVPSLGDSHQAVVTRWHVMDGAYVALDQPLCEIETDKAVVEMPAPAAGYVSIKVATEGTTVSVGDIVAVIATGMP